MTLIKHTIIIWSEPMDNPREINELAQDAMDGDSYCSKHDTKIIEDPSSDPDWDGTEFFNTDWDETQIGMKHRG